MLNLQAADPAAMPHPALMVVGCVVALLFLGLIPLLIVLAIRARRPTANKKAYNSLIILLVGWIGGGALSAAVGRGESNPLAPCLAAAIFLPAWLSSVAFAILGLLEMKREPARWIEGRGPAITALILDGL